MGELACSIPRALLPNSNPPPAPVKGIKPPPSPSQEDQTPPPAPVKGMRTTALCPTAWPPPPLHPPPRHVLTKLMANIPTVAVAKTAHCSVAHSFQKKPRTQAHLQGDGGVVRNQSCVAPQAPSAWGRGQLLAGGTLGGMQSQVSPCLSPVCGVDGGWEQLQPPPRLRPALALQKTNPSLSHPHPTAML